MNISRRLWILYGLAEGLLLVVTSYVSVRLVLGMRSPLAQNEALWLSRKPNHYVYDVKFLGGMRGVGPARIEVKNGVAISVPLVGEYGRLDSDIIDQLNTIDNVFAFVRETVKTYNERVELEFDPSWGFPSKAMMQAPWTEGDRWVDITSFKRLD